jgi:hypothetical protein
MLRKKRKWNNIKLKAPKAEKIEDKITAKVENSKYYVRFKSNCANGHFEC